MKTLDRKASWKYLLLLLVLGVWTELGSAWAISIPFSASANGPTLDLVTQEWNSVESRMFNQDSGRLLESVKDRGLHAWVTTKVSVLAQGARYDAQTIAQKLCSDLAVVHAKRSVKTSVFILGSGAAPACRADYRLNGQLHTQLAFPTQPTGFKGKQVYEMHYAEFFRPNEPARESIRTQLINRVIASVNANGKAGGQ